MTHWESHESDERNVNVSTKQAFSIFEDWKTKKSALLIIRLINPPPGVSTDIANFSGRIFRVDASLGRVLVIEGTPTSGEHEIAFDLAGTSFAIAPNIADPGGASYAVTARLRGGGMIFFIEDFSRGT